MLIYAHRSLLFSSDPSMMDKDRMIRVDAKPAPQLIPDWCRETTTFQAALKAKYIEEVDVPPDQVAAVAALSRRLAPSHVGPIAAETRPLRDYHPGSGLGKLSQF